MAGHAYVVAKEVFIMETEYFDTVILVKWQKKTTFSHKTCIGEPTKHARGC